MSTVTVSSAFVILNHNADKLAWTYQAVCNNC